MDEKKTWLEQTAVVLRSLSLVGMIAVFFSNLEADTYKSLFLLFASFICLCDTYIQRETKKRWSFWLGVGLGSLGLLLSIAFILLNVFAG